MLTFQTFGRAHNHPDPVLYLATFQNSSSWYCKRLVGNSMKQIATWVDFEKQFLSAFLSEDYEEELAERVRNQKQGDREPIRDFALSYRTLCKQWKPQIIEGEIVRMILKTINPASYPCRHANSINDLVRLGHQLEKDLH